MCSWGFFFTRISGLKKPFGAKSGEPLWISAALVKQKVIAHGKYGDANAPAIKLIGQAIAML
jgi:hypothetical protein